MDTVYVKPSTVDRLRKENEKIDVIIMANLVKRVRRKCDLFVHWSPFDSLYPPSLASYEVVLEGIFPVAVSLLSLRTKMKRQLLRILTNGFWT